MDLSHLSESEQIELMSLLESQDKHNRDNLRFSVYESLYEWQRRFIKSTSTHHECALIAGNQTGKTYTGSCIDAFHLLGEYPDSWDGMRFNFPPICWGLGYSMEKTRDLLQTALFGRYHNGKFRGGLVPSDRVLRWESATGTPNAMRSVTVKHSSGGESIIQFWSYSQGQHALMGDVVDWFHIDEEPRDQTIRPQVLTRTVNGDKGRGGRGIYTLTPENGWTELVIQFMRTPTKAQHCINAGWNDCQHITPEKAERMMEQYPPHQRDMRTKGIPMLGHGRIYDISEDGITCDPFEIPKHWYVIGGMDFGWDHPQAQIRLAIDMDNDIIYLTNAWKKSQCSATDAWVACKSWQAGVPIAWPHDGLQHEKGRNDSKMQKDHYSEAGFSMLQSNATWDGKSNSVEQGIVELRQRMQNGTFKVFRGCRDFFSEFAQYHRAETGGRNGMPGRMEIVKTMDDILDATRYAYMMRRFAIPLADVSRPNKTIDISFESLF